MPDESAQRRIVWLYYPNVHGDIEISMLREFGVPYGSRTRVAAVKGRCPRPLDERDNYKRSGWKNYASG